MTQIQTRIETLQNVPLAYYEKGYAEMAGYGEIVSSNPDASQWSWQVGVVACTYSTDASDVTRDLDLLRTIDDAPDDLRVLETFEKTQTGAEVAQYLIGPAGLHAVVRLDLEPQELAHPDLEAHINGLVRLHLGFDVAEPSLQDRQTAMNLLLVPLA